MAKHDTFLLRIDPVILKAIKQWAADELRSANGQIEFLLRDALNRTGRLQSTRPDNGHVAGVAAESPNGVQHAVDVGVDTDDDESRHPE